MLDYIYDNRPTPHIYLPQLLPPDLYQKVKFPSDIPVRAAGRSGRDLFMGEPGFAEAANSIGFRDLYALVCSDQFVRWVLSIFEDDLVRQRCRVSAKEAKLVDFLETREILDEWPDGLPGEFDVNELFNRFDFTIGGDGYTEYVHLDSPRRIVGGVLFFCDAKEECLEGGEFTLYRDLLFANDRTPHWPVPVKKFPVKGNTGVLFLNGNTGFHGPQTIRSIRGSRKWIYYSISSRVPVWVWGKPKLTSRVVFGIARRLGLNLSKPINPRSKLEANDRSTIG